MEKAGRHCSSDHIAQQQPAERSNSSFPPWKKMLRSLSMNRPNHRVAEEISSSSSAQPCSHDHHHHSQVRLAIYIAMAHAGLALAAFIAYGVFKLLEEYMRPILWAGLCSIPLRGIQHALVGFWSEPLSLGLTETFLAIPVALFKIFVGTVVEIKEAGLEIVLRIMGRPFASPRSGAVRRYRRRRSGFFVLLRWLVSLWVFVMTYEHVGRIASLALLAFGLTFSASGVESSMRRVSSFRSKSFRRSPVSSVFTKAILKRLKIIVAIGLIAAMTVGSLAGTVFFSYKIGMEGKDAVLRLQSHVVDNNYAERFGIREWMDEKDLAAMADRYTLQMYQAAFEHMDKYAMHYNLSEFVVGMKHLVMALLANSSSSGGPDSSTPNNIMASPPPPHHDRILSLKKRIIAGQWGKFYVETDAIFKEMVRVGRDGLAGRAKGAMRRALFNGASFLGGAAKVAFLVGSSILSGAAGVFNFVSQATVFLWVLYCLVTSESGGVTEQAMRMLPVPPSARDRCVEVLDKAISGVLLATAEIAFFQGCLTWLLFDLFSIHFLYASTVLAFASPLFPIFPSWLSTVPAALQLVLEGRYVLGVALAIIHLLLMEYGTAEIQEYVPGYSAYLTGLSIIGGMALLPSPVEGAVVGPLLTTIVIGLKDLYVEFVLEGWKDYSSTDSDSTSSPPPIKLGRSK
ncbi:unnamed protein product [Cuscuta campestris]|uniref:Transmembrane protein 245 n=1 Tax=Cuscuta campestris TaxID=132261 RepID=A0A484N964_9ASTE|nr:unnamed protein product [Cuscuta campestris]